MYVIKRNGQREEVSFDKILYRIKNLCDTEPKLKNTDCAKVAMKVIEGLYEGVSTNELDEHASIIASGMNAIHPEYSILGSRICISNLHKNTNYTFAECCKLLYQNNGSKNLISKELLDISQQNANLIEKEINYSRDYLFDYFGFKTLEKMYLYKINDKVIERPQHLFMRVAIGIHSNNLSKAFNTYHLLSQHYFIHATPTLFNAGTDNNAMLSCFLLGTDDSVDGMYKTIKDISSIAAASGGIGIHISNVRTKDALIKSTNGKSNGIVPLLRVINELSQHITQRSRPASVAIYLEPHHPEVLSFLDLRKNTGNEKLRCRELFTAIWLNDLFMKRVEKDMPWSLFSEDTAPGLSDSWGADYERLYKKYESEGRAVGKVMAKDIWTAILTSMIETGNPYIGYKDTSNRRSNQQNLGTIKSSNLCHEIIEYSNDKEYACCTLASISLPAFVNDYKFDHQKLREVVHTIVDNLDIIIDINKYPVPETKLSNDKHRPLGIGIQGLADTFMKLNIGFASESARKLNMEILETIYYSALEKSHLLALEKGKYSSFDGSPISKGFFQFELAGKNVSEICSGRWDFETLRKNIMRDGIRNSLLVALMPTASTSNILGNTECFEPITNNIYTRKTNTGDYVIFNKYLVNDLMKYGMWNGDVRKKLIEARGRVTNIPEIPVELKEKYQTAWEIPKKTIIEMARDRGYFVCQAQSMNLYFENIELSRLHSAMMFAWKEGLKTGVYYTRVPAAIEAQQFTIEPKIEKKVVETKKSEECVMCSA
jgi:ribonucleoside-diphosphate reductase alpha chain